MPVHMRFGVCLLAAIVLSVSSASAQDLNRLREIVGAAQGFQADFTYTTSSAYWDDRQVFTGRLVFRGTQYRVDTATEIIISHGPDTYTYRPSENQVLITATEPTFSPATLFGDFDQYYTVTGSRNTTYEGTPHHAVILQPRDPELPVVEATLWMRINDSMISRIQLVDVNETTTDLRLNNVQLHPQIDSAIFDLSFPEDVEIIDLRS